MTTSPVMGITDELLAELTAEMADAVDGAAFDHDEICGFTASAARALLAHIADLKQSLADADAAHMLYAGQVVELNRDAERLNKLDRIGHAYGFEDMHEGNRWMIDGPFRDIRTAIDAMEDSQ